MYFLLTNQTHQSELVVNLSQIKHNILFWLLVSESNLRARLLIEFAALPIVIIAVDAGHIDEHVNHFRAYLVVHHRDG